MRASGASVRRRLRGSPGRRRRRRQKRAKKGWSHSGWSWGNSSWLTPIWEFRTRSGTTRMGRMRPRRIRLRGGIAVLPFSRQNSPFWVKYSLFPEISSLLVCVGNCSKSRCGTAASCSEKSASTPRIAKFPVKFCRETGAIRTASPARQSLNLR